MAILCKTQHAFYRDTPGLQLSALHNGTGALMRICVQSIAPIMFGSPAKELALLYTESN